MKQWTRTKVMKGLQEMVPEITSMKKSEEFDGKKGGIWTTGDNAWIFQGLPPFNHNLEYGEILLSDNGDTDPKHKGMKVKEMYVYGIHREIYSWLEERGWYPKWHDPATLFFWKYTKDSVREIKENLKKFQVYHDFRENDGIGAEILEKLKEKFEVKND